MARSLILFTLAAILGGCCATFLAAAEPGKDRCVILVSVDGLADFYFDDPRAEMPTLRRLAENGARAAGMECSFPTVTWPNHTTLVTGVPPAKHGVLGNNYLDRQSAAPVPLIPDPLFDKDEIVKVPTIYDAAHRAGLSTSGIIWPATRNARTLDWTNTALRSGCRSSATPAFPSIATAPGARKPAAACSGTGCTRGWRLMSSDTILPTCC
jgi:predicted AlkP superfamily pyrophosphatase or phosphodiesterase